MLPQRLPRIALFHKDKQLPGEIALATSFVSRLRGLLLTSSLEEGMGLLIVPCGSIHMLGMRYGLEAVFLSSEGRVLKIIPYLSPWFGLGFCWGAKATLEWNPGNAAMYGVTTGDILSWKRV